MLMIKLFFGYGYSTMFVMFCAMSLSAAAAMADGLADFRNALTQLKSTDPIAVNAQFKLFGRSGEHGELIEREGVINMRLEDGANGLRAGLFRPISLWPYPEPALDQLVERVKGVLVVEMNAGQMLEDVERIVRGRVPVHFLGRMGGQVPLPEEIVAALGKMV